MRTSTIYSLNLAAHLENCNSEQLTPGDLHFLRTTCSQCWELPTVIQPDILRLAGACLELSDLHCDRLCLLTLICSKSLNLLIALVSRAGFGSQVSAKHTIGWYERGTGGNNAEFGSLSSPCLSSLRKLVSLSCGKSHGTAARTYQGNLGMSPRM